MKPKLIIGIVAIIGFTSMVMINFGESISSYTDFESAKGKNSAHIAGIWDDSKEYGFSAQQKQFSFYMEDEKGIVKKVVYAKPKPNNFEDADQIVVIGKMRGEIFYANDMLIKCPSKYNEGNPEQLTAAKEG